MTYDATILGLSPTNYYPTTETSGTTFADAGSSENGSLTGSHATLATAILGELGVEFTADDTYVSAAIGSIGVAGSWSCIMKVYSDTGNFAYVGYGVGGDNAPSSDDSRYLGTSFGAAAFGSEGVGPGGGASMPAGEYHLVGTQAAGGAQKLYVNGVLNVSSSYTPGTATGGALYFPMGAFDTPVPHVAIGKVAFWDGVVLSAGDVTSMYAALGTGGGGGGGGGGAAVGTRISWDGGLQLGTDGTATYEPPVDTSPTPLAERVILAQAIDSVSNDGTNFSPSVRSAQHPWTAYRVVVGGKDVTYFRGVQTPFPEYGLEAPLLYGSGRLVFPQIHAAYERPGQGALSWLKKFAKVRVQRVTDDGHIVTGGDRDYIGFISDFEHDGRDFAVTLGGEATGRAALQDRPVPIFPQVNDIGGQVMQTIQHSLRLPTANQPTTGVEVMETGGGPQLDWLSEVLAKSTQLDGTQWTVMPSDSGYRMFRKDTTTVDATVYVDGFLVSESLKRDFAEEPNRIWAQGVDPDGRRIRFAIYPGLVLNPRPPFPGSLSPGDSDDDVTTIAWRLYTVGYLDAAPFGIEWTTGGNDPLTDAIQDLQDDADLSPTGVVNEATWNAIFSPDVTGFTTVRASIKPAAQKPFTQAFLRDATGQIIGASPKYDRTRVFVDADLDMGAGFTRRQIQRFAKHEMADDNVSNWVGTITVNTGAVIDGEHNPGDPLDSSDLRDVRSLKPGMNLMLRNWDGADGTLVHISGVTVSHDSCELAVDTRARDTMKVWEVITRNRQSRRSPARQWIAQNRRSGMRDDTSAFYDGGSFGRIERTFCPADQWTVIASPAGRSGTLQTVDIQTTDAEALFGLAIFGEHVDSSWMARNVGNPFSKGYIDHVRKHTKVWGDDKFMVDIWGDKDQPCGYWPQVLDPTAFNRVIQTGSVDAASDRFTVDTHGYHNGQKVYFASGSVPAGLTADNDYYVIDATTNTFKVSATQGGSPMNITADHSGVAVSIHVADTPPVTGEFRFKAGTPYFCHGSPVLWIGVRPDRDCWVQGGRVLELLLDDSAG